MNKAILNRLRNSKGFIFDMDGTLVLGDKKNKGLKPLPGAIAFIRHLNQKNIPYILFTNGTVRPDKAYMPKLRDIGFPLRDDVIMTPSTVATEYFLRKQYRRVLVLGCEGVWRSLADAGIEVVLPADNSTKKIDAVYVGWYKEFVMGDLDVAYATVMNGAGLYSASMVPFFASAAGKAIGSSFVIAGMISKLTGARAKVLGKPSLEAMRSVSRRLGVNMKDIAVVGDDPQLEIPMAHKGKALAIAVHSGLSKAEEFARLPKVQRPHLSLDGVKTLLELYRNSS